MGEEINIGLFFGILVGVLVGLIIYIIKTKKMQKNIPEDILNQKEIEPPIPEDFEKKKIKLKRKKK